MAISFINLKASVPFKEAWTSLSVRSFVSPTLCQSSLTTALFQTSRLNSSALSSDWIAWSTTFNASQNSLPVTSLGSVRIAPEGGGTKTASPFSRLSPPSMSVSTSTSNSGARALCSTSCEKPCFSISPRMFRLLDDTCWPHVRINSRTAASPSSAACTTG